MTAPTNPIPADVEDLLKDARRVRFFTLVSLLERLTPHARRVGGDGPPSQEALRFRHSPTLSFATGDVEEAVQTEGRIHLTTTFLGLTGAASPLPTYLAEEVLHEDPQAGAQRDFLDVFHHRLLSLLFRWWSKHRFAREFERSLGDAWTTRALALAGESHLPAELTLLVLPLLVSKPRGARALRAALEQVVGRSLDDNLTVTVRPFVGGWVEVDDEARCALGVRNHRLGVDALLGRRVFDRSGSFAVHLTPVGPESYKRLAPEGDVFPLIQETVRLFTRDSVRCQLDLELEEDATPTLRLSREGGSALGKASWLRGRGSSRTVSLALGTHPVWRGRPPGSAGEAAEFSGG